MKKNVMMRVASIMLVLVLMSSSVISGTFAKYVTADSATDKARVAHWGVTVTAGGNLFSNSYKDNPTVYTTGENDRKITVQASASTDNVVAPGTKNETGMTFVLTGTPEVDVYVEFKFEVVDNKEIKLAAGKYADNPTTGKANDEFDVTKDYYPVVFTLKKDGNVLAQGNVAAIQAYLSGNLNKTYDANTNLAEIAAGNAGTYTLTWAWAFEDLANPDDPDIIDVMDTYLGNAAVGSPFPTTGATTEMEVKFSVSATQVD